MKYIMCSVVLSSLIAVPAIGGELASLAFEKPVINASAEKGAVINYLSTAGKRMTPELCKVTKGAEFAKAYAVNDGCIVEAQKSAGGIVTVEATSGDKTASFSLLSAKDASYSFEYSAMSMVFGEEKVNRLYHNGVLTTPETCSSFDGLVQTQRWTNGCLVTASTANVTDTVFASVGGQVVQMFSVTVGDGSHAGYLFAEPIQDVVVGESKFNELTLNGSGVTPSHCIAAASNIVSVGPTNEGCMVLGQQEGQTTVTAYMDATAVSDYVVNVGGGSVDIIDSDYDGVRDEYDAHDLVNDHMTATEGYGIEKWIKNIMTPGIRGIFPVSDRFHYYDSADKAIKKCSNGLYFNVSVGCVQINNSNGYAWDLQTTYLDYLTDEMKNTIQKNAALQQR